MRRTKMLGVTAACYLFTAGGPAWAGTTVQVSNPQPVVSASMTLVSAESNNFNCAPGQTLFNWDVTGKLKPSFRGFSSDIKLVCTTYAALVQGGPPAMVFPQLCNDGCAPVGLDALDACGNFEFRAQFCGTSPQLGSEYVCTFVAH